MLHPNVKDRVIVREASTLHNVDCAALMSQCYTRPSPHEEQPIQLTDIDNDMHEQVLVTIESEGHDAIGDFGHHIVIDSQDPLMWCPTQHWVTFLALLTSQKTMTVALKVLPK